MGYPDGYYYGQGRIICDTSTFSVGDTIRVRSMTDSSKVWNQQVATVGTALVFTVPCYDYYKICTVQDIGGTPTEIGGVYKTVDYGQTIFIGNMWDKSTLKGYQGILNAHQEQYLVTEGDKVPLLVDGIVLYFSVAAKNLYDYHELIFVADEIWTTSAFISDYFSTSYLIPILEDFYSKIEANDKALIKKKTVKAGATNNQAVLDTSNQFIWVPTMTEVFGTGASNIELDVNNQFPIFTVANDRIRKYNGTATKWYTASHAPVSGNYTEFVSATGTASYDVWSAVNGVLPCFRLTADS